MSAPRYCGRYLSCPVSAGLGTAEQHAGGRTPGNRIVLSDGTVSSLARNRVQTFTVSDSRPTITTCTSKAQTPSSQNPSDIRTMAQSASSSTLPTGGSPVRPSSSHYTPHPSFPISPIPHSSPPPNSRPLTHPGTASCAIASSRASDVRMRRSAGGRDVVRALAMRSMERGHHQRDPAPTRGGSAQEVQVRGQQHHHPRRSSLSNPYVVVV